jgi:hypothetical protein
MVFLFYAHFLTFWILSAHHKIPEFSALSHLGMCCIMAKQKKEKKKGGFPVPKPLQSPMGTAADWAAQIPRRDIPPQTQRREEGRGQDAPQMGMQKRATNCAVQIGFVPLPPPSIFIHFLAENPPKMANFHIIFFRDFFLHF